MRVVADNVRILSTAIELGSGRLPAMTAYVGI